MSKSNSNRAKRGRDQLLEDADLFKRYGALKSFLEFNWGRIGLELQRVRKPQDVSAAIKLVPHFEELPAFREFNALCFANDGTGPVRFSAVRKIKLMHEEAKEAMSNRWSDLHTSGPKFSSAQNNLRVAVLEFAPLAYFPSIFTYLMAMALEVARIRRELEASQVALRDAQTLEEDLRKKRAAREAWFAQNEILKLRRSKRHELNPDNLAKAMAGMPEYGWFNSFRRCDDLDIASFAPALILAPTAYPYQLFEMVREIAKRMKPLKLDRVKNRLLKELLLEENTMLRETVKPHWLHMQRAFADHRGKRFTHRTLPYLLIASFLDRMELGTSAFDTELAKYAQAELNVENQPQ